MTLFFLSRAQTLIMLLHSTFVFSSNNLRIFLPLALSSTSVTFFIPLQLNQHFILFFQSSMASNFSCPLPFLFPSRPSKATQGRAWSRNIKSHFCPGRGLKHGPLTRQPTTQPLDHRVSRRRCLRRNVLKAHCVINWLTVI